MGNRIWTQAEVVRRTGASSGLVSRIIQHLISQGGFFTETQHRGGRTLVSDAQIYLDLQRTGLRGPDAASALREWEGFCRP